MAAREFYDKCVPGCIDLNNITGTIPYFRIVACEIDGAIGLSINPFKKNSGGYIDLAAHYVGWFNIKEAREFVAGIQEAIDSAVEKCDGQEDSPKDRVHDPESE